MQLFQHTKFSAFDIIVSFSFEFLLNLFTTIFQFPVSRWFVQIVHYEGVILYSALKAFSEAVLFSIFLVAIVLLAGVYLQLLQFEEMLCLPCYKLSIFYLLFETLIEVNEGDLN